VHTLLLALTLAAGMENPLTKSVANRYQEAKRNLVESADLMPAESYGFRLTPGQRPFGEWIGHTAISVHGLCASIRGVAPPDTKRLHALTGKPQLTAALKESFTACDTALEGMTDSKALAPLPKGDYPVQHMVALIALLNQHYGNLVGYLRMKGLTPPSTARRTMRTPEQSGKAPKPEPPRPIERR
jgi:hypothetical protein